MFRYRVFAVYRDNLPLIATCVQQQLMLEPQPKQGHPNQAQHTHTTHKKLFGVYITKYVLFLGQGILMSSVFSHPCVCQQNT